MDTFITFKYFNLLYYIQYNLYYTKSLKFSARLFSRPCLKTALNTYRASLAFELKQSRSSLIFMNFRISGPDSRTMSYIISRGKNRTGADCSVPTGSLISVLAFSHKHLLFANATTIIFWCLLFLVFLCVFNF